MMRGERTSSWHGGCSKTWTLFKIDVKTLWVSNTFVSFQHTPKRRWKTCVFPTHFKTDHTNFGISNTLEHRSHQLWDVPTHLNTDHTNFGISQHTWKQITPTLRCPNPLEYTSHQLWKFPTHFNTDHTNFGIFQHTWKQITPTLGFPTHLITDHTNFIRFQHVS